MAERGFKTVREAQRSVSDLEFEVWKEWKRRQWNEPSRTDHYLMRLAILLQSSETPLSLDSQKIPFTFEQAVPETEEDKLKEERKRAMMSWKARLPGLRVVSKSGRDVTEHYLGSQSHG